ncbi:MAG: Rrf2 family transcriptional regulator [Acidobacteriota bacterium]
MNSQLAIALHILGFLASRDGEALTSDLLARTYGTSPVVLRRVLAKLQRAGLVETQRGAGGGSVLARDASAMTLRDAYLAVAGKEGGLLPQHPGGCDGVIAPILASYVNEMFSEAEQALLDKLGTITIAAMDRHIRSQIVAARRGQSMDC